MLSIIVVLILLINTIKELDDFKQTNLPEHDDTA